MDRLKGKIALITGAGTGVGRACMKLFAAEGAKVVGVSRTKANLDETLAQVKAAGGEGQVVAADLSRPEGAEKAVAETLKTFERIDILVNSAGVGYSWLEKSPGSMGPVDDTTPEKWHEVMAINLDSLYYMCRLVIPEMKKQGGGSIVNVTSISGFQGLPGGSYLHGRKRGGDQPHPFTRNQLLRRQHPRQLHRPGLYRHPDGRPGAGTFRRSGRWPTA